MTESLRAAATAVFHHPSAPAPRRHGPRGYLDYTSFKAWLRDEFTFRCVYCLTSEPPLRRLRRICYLERLDLESHSI